MRKAGWFAIPGKQDGARTLKQQLKGLAPALAAAAGKTVCDLGCAEGLIALEFAKAGARSVYACDYNAGMIETARALQPFASRASVRFEVKTLEQLIAEEIESDVDWRYDIVLALAILHKLRDPVRALAFLARVCGELAVIRLPKGSTGAFETKWYGTRCDVNRELTAHGLALDQQLPGPDGEWVQYWRRA